MTAAPESVERWCWRLLPLAAALAGWAIWQGRAIGETLLPATVISLQQDWALAERLTGRPL